MVQMDDPESNWLNGRAPMPHENCPPASHVHDRPRLSQVCLNHNPVPVTAEFPLMLGPMSHCGIRNS